MGNTSSKKESAPSIFEAVTEAKLIRDDAMGSDEENMIHHDSIMESIESHRFKDSGDMLWVLCMECVEKGEVSYIEPFKQNVSGRGETVSIERGTCEHCKRSVRNEV